MQKTSMILPYEFEIVFQSLPIDEAGKLILAIYAYEQRNIIPDFSENPALMFAWNTHIKPKIDENIEKYKATCEARRTAGSKGGRPSQENQNNQEKAKKAIGFSDNQNNQKVSEKAKEPDYDGDGDGDYDGDGDGDYDGDGELKEKIIKKEKSQKHKYGQYQNVLLSDDELAKLKTEFPADWEERIERVSEYCASKGVTYKNYLATIRSWARKERPKIVPVKKNDVQSGLAQALEILGVQDG